MSVAAAAELVTLQRFTSRLAIAGGSAPSSEVSGPGAGRSGKLAAHRMPNTTANTSANTPPTTSTAIDVAVKFAAASSSGVGIPKVGIGRVCRTVSLRGGFWAEYDCWQNADPNPWGETMDRLTKTYSVFDCDAHINDPMGIWDHVPESKKELVRNTYWRGDGEAWLNGDTPVMGGGNAHFPGYNPICIAGPQMNKKIMRKLNAMPLTAEQKAYLHHDGAIDPAARLIEMDLMGIDQVLVIPTMVIMHVPFATNAEGVAAFCEAYNDFVVDWCSEESSRLFAAAFLPAQDAGYTVKEIERAAGLGLPVGPHPPDRRAGQVPERRRAVDDGQR